MPSTSGYNLRPSRGVKGMSRPTNEKMTQQGGPVGDRESENISTTPTSKSKQFQAAGIPEAEVFNSSIARRGEEERTATNPSPWRSQ
ncbi:hypothetical protein TNCV_2598101 [Trichonephila clavipes]|nr:hypothetical protein TNCV_2598101 [Trichonephila clavipes]